MSDDALFDIVIPSLNTEMAHETVASLRKTSTYAHNYIIIHNGDRPTGYIEPCNRGLKAGNSDLVCFVNDDALVTSDGWDEVLLEEANKGSYCFGPWTPAEENMRLNGWFLCLRRDYINVYGWAFDPQFICWCGDIDLLKRLEEDGIEPVMVQGIEVEHAYSKTFANPTWQQWFIQEQMKDLDKYRIKWGSDPNFDKLKNS